MLSGTQLVIYNVKANIDAMKAKLPRCRTSLVWPPWLAYCSSTQAQIHSSAKNIEATFNAWRAQASMVNDGSVPFDRWAATGESIAAQARSLVGIIHQTSAGALLETAGEELTDPTNPLMTAAYIGLAGLGLIAIIQVASVLPRKRSS